MSEHGALIEKIAAYCRQAEIAESTFGRRVVNDGKFVGRLREGKRVTTSTISRVEKFLQENPADCDQTETYDPRLKIRTPTQTVTQTHQEPGRG